MFDWMSAKAKVSKMMEPGGAYEGGVKAVSSGLVRGARVATSMGWRPVEALAVGDMVLTFDGGLQPVTRITRERVWESPAGAPRRFWPLHVPAGALGNRAAMDILPNQYVMIESDAGEALYGDPFSLMRAALLDGMNGIEAHPPAPDCEAIVLHFETEQVVFDRSGLLFYCPSSAGLLGETAQAYEALTKEAAEALVRRIERSGELSDTWATEAPIAASAAA